MIVKQEGMELKIILSHVNTDLDALASMIAAKKLYPDAQLVISDKQDNRVRRFLNIYRDMFDFIRDIHVDWPKVTTIILVDVASLSRVGRIPDDLDAGKLNIIVYDHHPKRENDVEYDDGIVEQVGAAATLLIEKIRNVSYRYPSLKRLFSGLAFIQIRAILHTKIRRHVIYKWPVI